MPRGTTLLLLCATLSAFPLLDPGLRAQASGSPADAVNPLVGTANEGNTFPGVGVPFGMTAWTPATSATEKKGVIPYVYKAGRIVGFRGSHFLSGSATQDYGSFQVIAGGGDFPAADAARTSVYSHSDERSHPYRYDVGLPDLNVRAAVTATARCGMLAFTFAQSGPAWAEVQNLARGGDGTLTVDAEHREIVGVNPVRRIYLGNGQLAGFSGYVVVQFDHAFQPGTAWKGNGAGAGAPVSMATEQAGANQGAPVEYRPAGVSIRLDVRSGETVHARIGTSFVSVEEARRNLAAEMPDWNFAGIEKAAHAAWDRELGRIEITAPETDRRVFYTAMYHAFQLPRIVNDSSGTRPEFASGEATHTAHGRYYDDFSLWDTFRAVHPLLTLLDPERDGEMIQSLVDKGNEGGFLPIFPAWSSYTSEMVGDHAVAVIADGYLKGIRNFDVDGAYRLMRRNAFEQPKTAQLYRDGRGRRALDDYMRLGYIPLENPVSDAFHQREQVSRTLEYAYDDFAVAQIARALHHDADADALLKRSGNYRNVIDPKTGFARGRHADGTWDSPFDPGKPYPYITEGLPFQYTFFVPQDLPGLIALEGGKPAFTAKLDELFARRYYDHGNEPSHAITYLYDYAGEAWKTQDHVAEIRSAWYQDRPDGLAGNDDAGQMSAWYLFSALGFYPVTPGIPAYEIGTPLLPSATLHLPGGKTLRIRAEGVSPVNRYIQSATWNGRPLDRFWLRHAEIAAGGDLLFRMGPQPNKGWPASQELPH